MYAVYRQQTVQQHIFTTHPSLITLVLSHLHHTYRPVNYLLSAICHPSDRTVVSDVVVVCNRSKMRTSKCTCLIFGVSIGLDPSWKCTKGIFDRSHSWEENEHFLKLSNVNKLVVNKLVLKYNVSMGAGNIGTGSRSYETYR